MSKINTDSKVIKDFIFFKTVLQSRNSFVATNTIQLIHLLIALDTFPNSPAKFIQEHIKLKQSNFSSLCKDLESLGFISRKKDTNDNRIKLLNLTKKGRTEVERFDKELNRLIDQRKKNLDSAEMKQLIQILHEIGDFFNIAKEPVRESEHPLRAAQRRFSRSFGMSSVSFFGLDISTSVWHILFLLKYEIDEISIKDIAERLSLSHNSISTHITKLQSEGLVTKRTSEEDARTQYVELTSKGKKKLALYEKKILEYLQSILPSPLISRIQKVNILFSRYYSIFTDLPAPYVVKKFTQEKSLIIARSFLIEQIVRQKHHNYCPESIASKKSHKVYGLYKNKELMAVAQFLITDVMELDCCAWSSKLKSKELKEFVRYLLSTRKRAKDRIISFVPLKKMKSFEGM